MIFRRLLLRPETKQLAVYEIKVWPGVCNTETLHEKLSSAQTTLPPRPLTFILQVLLNVRRCRLTYYGQTETNALNNGSVLLYVHENHEAR